MPSPRRAVVLPSVAGVAPSSTAQLTLPLGRTYHHLMVTSGNAISTISGVRVKVNGGAIMEMTGAQLDAINQFYTGVASGDAPANVFPIYFDSMGLKTRQSGEITALGTAPYGEDNPRPVQTAVVEFDLDSTLAPSLDVHGVVSPPTPSGFVRKVKRYTYQPGGVGDLEISDLPKGDAIAAIHGTKATDDISRVRVIADGFDIYDRTADVMRKTLASQDFARERQAAYFHVDFREAGYGGEVVTPAVSEDFRVVLTLGSAETTTLIVETVGPVPV